MINAIATILSSSGGRETIEIRFFDDSGSGIERIRIFDKDFTPLPVVRPSGCPIEFTAEVTIDHDQRPLWVEGTTCDDGPRSGPDANGPLLPPIIEIDEPCRESDGVVNCEGSSSECLEGFNLIQEIYSRLEGLCRRCPGLREQERLAADMAWAYLGVGLAFWLMAGLALNGGFWGVILAALLFVTGIMFMSMSRQFANERDEYKAAAERCERELRTTRREFELARDALEDCCATCFSAERTAPC